MEDGDEVNVKGNRNNFYIQILLLFSYTFHRHPRKNKYLSNQIGRNRIKNLDREEIEKQALFILPLTHSPTGECIVVHLKKANIYETKRIVKDVRISIPLESKKKKKKKNVDKISLLFSKERSKRRDDEGGKDIGEQVWPRSKRTRTSPTAEDRPIRGRWWATGRFTGSWTGHNSPPPDNS